MFNPSSIRFERRPSPVIPEHRPLYKIAQLLLILLICSRGGRSSSARLQLFNWALKRQRRCERLVKAASTRQIDLPAWGFDPALAIALRFAVGEKLLRSASKGYELTERGQAMAEDIRRDPEVFPREKEGLLKIGKGITEAMVEAASKEWSV